jgi:hypothetical protein
VGVRLGRFEEMEEVLTSSAMVWSARKDCRDRRVSACRDVKLEMDLRRQPALR